MVFSYWNIKQLRKKKYDDDKEITVEEVRKLEEYIKEKEKAPEIDAEWSRKQELRAKKLLQDLKKEVGLMEAPKHD